MLSDEELKEIEAALLSQHAGVHRGKCGDGLHHHHDDRCSTIPAVYGEKLLAEVKRLRSGWQSVADGAKPDPEDWYAARCHHEIGTHGDGGRVRSITYHAVHMSGGEGFSNVTHFLVIPPPPIKRES